MFLIKKFTSWKISKMPDQKLYQVILETEDYDIRKKAINQMTDAKALADAIIRKPDLFGHIYDRLKELDDEQAWVDLVLHYPYLTSDKCMSTYEFELDNKNFERCREIVQYKINDPKQIERIALECCHRMIRIFAAQKVEDQAILAELAVNSDDSEMRCEAIKKLEDDDLLKKIALTGSEERERIEAVKRIKDEEFLIEMALRNEKGISKTAVLNPSLKDQAALIRIYHESEIERVRQAAAVKIRDEKTLDEIDMNKEYFERIMDGPDRELQRLLSINSVIMDRIASDTYRDRDTRAIAAIQNCRGCWHYSKQAVAQLVELLKNGDRKARWCGWAASRLKELYEELAEKDEDPETRALIATIQNNCYGPSYEWSSRAFSPMNYKDIERRSPFNVLEYNDYFFEIPRGE